MKNIINEFKKFAIRGNVMDLAVGVIIGSAFTKIVTSLVDDIVMPPLGLAVGGLKFSDYKLVLKPDEFDATGHIVKSAVTLNYGNFIQILVNFLVVALTIFVLVKVVNMLRERVTTEPEKEKTSSAQPNPEVVLLTEIRDVLKTRQSK